MVAVLGLLLAAEGSEAASSGRGRVAVSAGLFQRAVELHSASAPLTGVNGLSPTRVGLRGAWFFADFLGAAGEVSVEWYRVVGTQLDRTTAASLPMLGARGSAALAGRWQALPWLGLEARLGYGALRSPVVDASGSGVVAAAVSAHGPFAGLTATVDPPGVLAGELSLRAMPFSVRAQGPNLASMQVSSWGGTAQLSVGRLELLGTRGSLFFEYEFTRNGGTFAGGSFGESTHQVGAGVRVLLGLHSPAALAPSPTGPGLLRGRVVGAAGVGLADALVSVGATNTRTDSSGQFELGPLAAGRVSATASAPGYRTRSGTTELTPGGVATLNLTLERPTGPGEVRGVVEFGAGKPVGGLEVGVEGVVPVKTGEDGRFTLSGVGPGLVALKVRGPDIETLEEPLRIAPEATLEVKLTVRQKGVAKLGVIRGLIQTAGGRPVAATVRVVEVKRTTKVGRDGRFEMTVPGGSYRVVVEAPGYVTRTLKVDLASGDHAIFHCELQPVSR